MQQAKVTLGLKKPNKQTETLTTKEVATVTAPKKEAKPEERYVIGKRYVPKTERNSETWGKITKAVAEGPKTLAELAKVAEGHKDFVGYMTRGGHLVIETPAK